MLQLIYTSISSSPLTRALMEEICDSSRENNCRDEITGILLSRENRFLQAIEGPKVTVEDTFIRIVTDTRHYSAIVLSRRMITRREFGDWDMRHCSELDDCLEVIDIVQRIMTLASAASQRVFSSFLNGEQAVSTGDRPAEKRRQSDH